MSKNIDAIQFRNEDGDYVYAKTHLDAIDGMEEYTEGLTQVAQLLGDYIFDTGWKEYDTHIDVEKNSLYASDGFRCGIREVILNPSIFGNGNQTRLKMIRVNLRGFVDGQQIAQLPTGFIGKAQRFQMSGNGNRKPYIIEVLSDGKVVAFVHRDESNNSSNSNWIYGQYTWVE